MNGPEMTPAAQAEWDRLQHIVQEDIERQIDDHIAEKAEKNRQRARFGLPPL